MSTSFFFLLACLRTTSVPCTLVSIVWTGASTISFTPTAAARCTTTSQRSTSSASSGSLVTRVDRVVEVRMRLEMGDVVDRAGRQVVEDEDLVAALEQRLGQVGADEAGAAGDQNTHQ